MYVYMHVCVCKFYRLADFIISNVNIVIYLYVFYAAW